MSQILYFGSYLESVYCDLNEDKAQSLQTKLEELLLVRGTT